MTLLCTRRARPVGTHPGPDLTDHAEQDPEPNGLRGRCGQNRVDAGACGTASPRPENHNYEDPRTTVGTVGTVGTPETAREHEPRGTRHRTGNPRGQAGRHGRRHAPGTTTG